MEEKELSETDDVDPTCLEIVVDRYNSLKDDYKIWTMEGSAI